MRFTCVLLFCVGCNAAVVPDSGSFTHDDPSTIIGTGEAPPHPAVSITLALSDETYTGMALVEEVEPASSADCVGGVFLEIGYAEGIRPSALAFVDRVTGTASQMVDVGVSMEWSNDSTAEAVTPNATHEWVGTYLINSWSDDLIDISLDGVQCDLPNRSVCFDSFGTLTIAGVRSEAYATTSEASFDAGVNDVATGDAVCYRKLGVSTRTSDLP